MITLKEACLIIQKELPNNRITGASEIGDYYFFSVPPRRWKGGRDIPCGGAVYYVTKNGIFDCMNIGDYMDMLLEKGETTLDIRPFLSDEDRVFLDKIEQH